MRGECQDQKEGNALMQAKGQRETRQYLQSRGNLALADESLGVLQKPKAKTRSPRLSMVPDITEELEVDALTPTTGILNGIRLSLTLWSLKIGRASCRERCRSRW